MPIFCKTLLIISLKRTVLRYPPLCCFIFVICIYIFNTPLLFGLDHDKIWLHFHGNDTRFGAFYILFIFLLICFCFDSY